MMIFTSMDDPPLTQIEMVDHGFLKVQKVSAFSREIELVSHLHENPLFLPWEHIRDNVIPAVLVTIACIVVIHQTMAFFLAKRFPSKNPRAYLYSSGSYRATNLLVNLFLGVVGTYHYTQTLPQSPTPSERVEGFDSLYWLAAVQFGYNAWGIPMGLFLANESPGIILHHVCVMVGAFQSGCFSNGCRYINPFFFGLIEMSSIPLSVMNFMKDHRDVYKSAWSFHAVRITFAVSFLFTRVYLWMPEMYQFIRICVLMGYTCTSAPPIIFWTSAFWVMVILSILQLFWASKIVKGLLGIVLGESNNLRISVLKKVD